MPKNNETTTKFKVDISELKAGFQEAQRTIRVANSEFKAATAGMDDWSKSADGLGAKIKQLNTVLDSEKAKLSSLEKQYALVSKEQGENSKGAQELLIKINNQKAAIGNTEKQIRQYNEKLDQMKSESSNAESAAEDLSKAVEDAGDSSKSASDGFTVLKGALASLIADGITKCVDSFKSLMTSSDKALNSLQVQTGMSTKEIAKFSSEMDDLYKNNYGESMEDIADAMAIVAQNSKETDPTKIKDLTKNALMLQKAFDFDVNETMRAANMLIDQFGITGEEAFNLIAQGAQNGLNKNGDLLDSINEYGVHYKQMGYSAEEFFNSLQNGTEAGTFSVDKLGDAMKEFGIRTKDSSKSTADAFKAIGLATGDNSEALQKAKDKLDGYNSKIADLENKLKYAKMQQAEFTDKTSELTKVKLQDNIAKWTKELSTYRGEAGIYENTIATMTESAKNGGQSVDDLFAKFAEGGNSAKQATSEVLTALFSMDDKVAQDAAGVALFGTMWEDLGADGVKALMDVNGEADKTAQTMKDIDAVQYGDVGSQLTALGRTIETDLIKPLVTSLQPYLDSAIKWAQENLPKVVEKIKEIASAGKDVIGFLDKISPLLAALGTAIAGLALIGLIQNIGAVGAALKAWALSTKVVTAAQWLLNAAMSANPISLIVIAIAALVAAFVVLWKKSEGFRNFWIGLWEGVKNAFSAVVDWFKENWKTLILFLMNPIAGLFKYFYDHFEGFRNFVDKFVQSIKAFFSDLWEGIKNIFSTVGQFFTGVWNGVKKIFSPAIQWFTKLFTSVWQTIKDIGSNIVGIFKGVWEIIKLIFTPVVAWFKNIFQKALDGIKKIWNGVKAYYQGIWNGIKKVFSTVGSWFKEKFTSAWNGIKSAFSKVGEFFSNVWEAVKKPFNSVASWFKDTFKKAWEGVKNVFSTGGKIFDGIKDGIASTFKTVVNGIIRGINKVVSVPFNAINAALRKIRDASFLGITPFKDKISEINVPQIPELARGGVLKKGQVGFLEGDGDEAVVPLQKNTDWLDEVARRIYNKMDMPASGRVGTTVNNFYQTNNSPKSLSRLDIYRQSKNLLSMKGV